MGVRPAVASSDSDKLSEKEEEEVEDPCMC